MPEGSTKLIQAPDVCWNKSFKAACSKKGMINGWVPREFTKKQLPQIWKHPREKPFRSGFSFLGRSYPQKNFPKLRVEPSRGWVERRHDSLPWGTTALWLWTTDASIAVASSKWTRHKSLWMYQFWFRGSISDIISFGFGSYRGQLHEIEWTMFTLFQFKYCSSINVQVVKTRTSNGTCFCF